MEFIFNNIQYEEFQNGNEPCNIQFDDKGNIKHITFSILQCHPNEYTNQDQCTKGKEILILDL